VCVCLCLCVCVVCVCVCVCVCVVGLCVVGVCGVCIEIMGGGGCTLNARLNDKMVGLTKTQTHNGALCALLKVRSYRL